MIKGFYAAVSAMVVGATRQETLAHNLANLDTPGFKQILNTMDEFTHTSVLFSPGNVTRSPVLRAVGNLGLGVELNPEATNFSAGALKLTGNKLDFAIQGEGFFRLLTPDGERYTRDGRFLVDAQGNLVNINGFKVLDQNGQAIILPEGATPEVSTDGTLRVEGQVVAQIGLALFDDPENQLGRDQFNTFRALGAPSNNPEIPRGLIHQGALEMSNVNPSQLMAQMVMIARSYEAAQQMAQLQDELLGQAIRTLGRI
ncbi:flagellar hook-basal body protein [Thermanaerothrix sp.]|uniref:flagellar hook-basal body protein n=1 Tax=Thermanaerothrix sp. TaxID=2972675 RepID=UPI003C7E9D6C